MKNKIIFTKKPDFSGEECHGQWTISSKTLASAAECG